MICLYLLIFHSVLAPSKGGIYYLLQIIVSSAKHAFTIKWGIFPESTDVLNELSRSLSGFY